MSRAFKNCRSWRESVGAHCEDMPKSPGGHGFVTGSLAGTLVTCDLICYGVASPASFSSYLDMLGKHHGASVVRYAHRGSGIPDRGDETAWFADGTAEHGTSWTRVWTRLWYRNLIRESCTACGYHALERPGNLTIGDFWGIEGVIPGFADAWGTSCIIANDERGLALVQSAADAFELREARVEDVANDAQPMLRTLPPYDASRRFFVLERDLGFERACRVFGLLGWKASIREAVRGVSRMLKTKHGDAGCGNESQSAPRGGKAALLGARSVIQEDAQPIAWDEPIDLPRAFAAKNRSDGVRRESSSGGVFHALASKVIERGGVVYGCAFDERLHAVHIRCETMTDVCRCMGSKYTQSDLGDILTQVRDDLSAGKLVFFTGMPCQVAAVRTYTGDGDGAKTVERGGWRSAGPGDLQSAKRVTSQRECRTNPSDSPTLFSFPQACCGCTACAAACPVGAISMQADEHGFPYPAIEATRCIDCGTCLAICTFKTRTCSGEAGANAKPA